MDAIKEKVLRAVAIKFILTEKGFVDTIVSAVGGVTQEDIQEIADTIKDPAYKAVVEQELSKYIL